MSSEALLPADFWFLVILIALVALAWIVRWLEGDWLAPGSFFVGYWTINLAFCYVAGPAFSVSPAAAAWVAAALASFAVGALMSRPLRPRVVDVARVEMVKIEHLGGIRTSIALCTGLGLAAVPAMLWWSGESLGAVFSPEGLLAIASDLTVRRYTGEREPAVVSLLLAAIYLGALLAGTLGASRYTSNRKYTQVFVWLPLVPALAYSTVTTAKATIILTGFLWLAAFIVTSKLNRRFNINATFFAKFLASLLVASAVFTALQALRYDVELRDLLELAPILQVYATGHLVAFSNWFDANWYSIDPKFGLILFAGVADFLEISPRVAGLYEEIVEIGGSSSNVYTAFRAIIEDFGVAGALALLGLFGWFAAWSFKLARLGYSSALTGVVFAYSFMILSPITSVTTYNSLLLAFTLYGTYLAIAFRPRSANAGLTARYSG